MMKRVILITISLLSATCRIVSATEENWERIILDGEKWEMNGSPFSYMEDDMRKRLTDLAYLEVDVIALLEELGSSCPDEIAADSRCARGYVGTWIVENGHIYLDHIWFVNEILNEKKLGYRALLRLFPQYIHNGRLRADWVDHALFLLADKEFPWNKKVKFMDVKRGRVSFSRQFGNNPHEDGIPIVHLLEEYLPLYFSTFYYKRIPGKYNASLQMDDVRPGHFLLRGKLVRLPGRKAWNASDHPFNWASRDSYLPIDSLDIKNAVRDSPWDIWFTENGVYGKRGKNRYRWRYETVAADHPECHGLRLLSEKDTIRFEIFDSDKDPLKTRQLVRRSRHISK